jgi:mannosyltransferase OCH1-like enzyme
MLRRLKKLKNTLIPPRKHFTYSDVRRALRRTAAKNFSTGLPLPYAESHGCYKGFPLQKKIHFIWIGSRIPAKYISNIRSFWRLNPAFQILLWVDHECEPIEDIEIRRVDPSKLINARIYDSAKNIGIKADVLRLEVVFSDGGIYSNIDAVALKPFDATFDNPFLAYEPHTYKDIANRAPRKIAALASLCESD